MGSHLFLNVDVPLLWGTRAILQDPDDRLSIIDLGRERAMLEVLEDEPAQGVAYAPRVDGFVIMDEDSNELYKVNPKAKAVTPVTLNLPPVTISRDAIRVGTNTFQSNLVSGAQVGIMVTENSIGIGGPLPAGLAALRV